MTAKYEPPRSSSWGDTFQSNPSRGTCGYQAGGVKWTADYATIKHSKVHDNACKGLWVDLNGDHTKILDNNVY